MALPTPRELAMDDGHVLGNFHAYYSFNPVHERLRFMDAPTSAALRSALLLTGDESEGAATPATIMDIGCNEGDLTLGLFKHLVGATAGVLAAGTNRCETTFDASSVSTLNERAQKSKQQIEYVITEDGSSEHRRHFVCDLRIDGVSVASGDGVSKKVAKAKAATAAMRKQQEAVVAGTQEPEGEPAPSGIAASATPISSRRRLCVLGVDVDEDLVARARQKAIAPETDQSDVVAFAHANAMEASFQVAIESFLESIDCAGQVYQASAGQMSRRPFDLITLFSVTMWIHLNHGDDGLWKFLDTVAEQTNHLIVEPQPWKCYRNAINRLSRSRVKVPPSFTSLKVREDVVGRIDAFLLDTGRFRCKADLGKTNWSRPLLLYSRKPIAGIHYQSR